MTQRHDKRPPSRVGEPVQVYLDRTDRKRLGELAEELGATKSDVLRRALLALEQQVRDPAANPLLKVIGLASDTPSDDPGYDVAIEHDRYLAESEEQSWNPKTKRRPKKRAR